MMSGVIEDFKKLSASELENMSQEEFEFLTARFAVADIHANCMVIDVALVNNRLDRDDIRKIILVREVFREVLQKAFPDREW